jgi:hypothetical protein
MAVKEKCRFGGVIKTPVAEQVKSDTFRNVAMLFHIGTDYSCHIVLEAAD